jgi:uncharacterized protein YoxC
MLVAAFTWGDLWRLALAVFLLAVGLSAGYLLVRLGGTAGRLSAFISGAEQEILPVINKVGGSVDRVNSQLDKVDRVTDSAVDAVESVDTAVRTVSQAVTRPVQKVSGFAAGVSYGAADFKAKRDWKHAVQAGKDAAIRREEELAEDIDE